MQLQQLGLPRRDATQTEMQLAEASFDMPHQSFALWRQANATAFTFEQHCPEILFKTADGMTDRTRRQTQVVGRQSERPGSCRRLKRAQSSQVKIAKHVARIAPDIVSEQAFGLLTRPRVAPHDVRNGVIRDRVEPVESPAMSAMPPKAEVNSEH
jgi:hypothetical protein